MENRLELNYQWRGAKIISKRAKIKKAREGTDSNVSILESVCTSACLEQGNGEHGEVLD